MSIQNTKFAIYHLRGQHTEINFNDVLKKTDMYIHSRALNKSEELNLQQIIKIYQ